MNPAVNQSPSERVTIIIDRAQYLISPNALKILRYLLSDPKESYSTEAIREGTGFDQKRNLRPYFTELQGLGLLQFEASHGAVAVSKLATRLMDTWGVPVFESCKKEEA